MPRRASAIKRYMPPDPKYGSYVLSRLIKKLMQDGKKATAERIMYDALDVVAERTKSDPMEILDQALKNATPLLQVKARRVGGATYQVPVEVRPDRALALAMRWILRSARTRAGKSMAAKLAEELLDASKGQGAAAKKREDTHRMAEANRAFAHYRW